MTILSEVLGLIAFLAITVAIAWVIHLVKGSDKYGYEGKHRD